MNVNLGVLKKTGQVMIALALLKLLGIFIWPWWTIYFFTIGVAVWLSM